MKPHLSASLCSIQLTRHIFLLSTSSLSPSLSQLRNLEDRVGLSLATSQLIHGCNTQSFWRQSSSRIPRIDEAHFKNFRLNNQHLPSLMPVLVIAFFHSHSHSSTSQSRFLRPGQSLLFPNMPLPSVFAPALQKEKLSSSAILIT